MAPSIIKKTAYYEFGNISNKETIKLYNVRLLFLYRFFNNNDKKAIFSADFASTVGSFVNTFGSDVVVTKNGTEWTIKNNIDGVISYTVFYE